MIKTIHPSSIVDQITTATDKRFDLAARMADVIVDTTLADGDCLPQDLTVRGFTQKDIDALWHFANALSAVELRCRKNETSAPFGNEVRYA